MEKDVDEILIYLRAVPEANPDDQFFTVTLWVVMLSVCTG
jgi:hypothetical protein